MRRNIKVKILLLEIFLFSAFISPTQADEYAFKSSKYLYDQCKNSLAGDNFDESYCAAYIEGYMGGGFTVGLHVLGEADNQNEIIEKQKSTSCHHLDDGVSRDQKIKWFAEYFTNWIDNNQDIIAKESAFIHDPAVFVFHTISTDERFCTNSKLQGR